MEEMSKDEYITMNNVRKEIWSKGLYGYVVGSCSGVVLHTTANVVDRYRKLPIALNRNTLIASFFLGGTLGSFILASVAGKNEVHNLHHIFPKGASPPPQSTTTYDEIREKATMQTWTEGTSVDRKE